jgi:hypothetical protein
VWLLDHFERKFHFAGLQVQYLSSLRARSTLVADPFSYPALQFLRSCEWSPPASRLR